MNQTVNFKESHTAKCDTGPKTTFLLFPEGTLRAYCREVGIEYEDSMVNWGPITEEQRQIFPSIEDIPGLKFFIG